MSGYDLVIEKLEDRGLLSPAQSGEQLSARCPAHDDSHASLSISEGEKGKPLVYCFAGCAFKDVIDALGLKISDVLGYEPNPGDRTLVAQYVYTNEFDEPLIRVSRWEPKGFTQEHWEDGGWRNGRNGVEAPLYRLPEVLQGLSQSSVIYLCEGEKDVHTIRATQTGVTATTLIGGAGKRSNLHALSTLEGAEVVVICDRDDAGRAHGALLLDALSGLGTTVRLAWPAEGKDVTDHIYAGYTLDELLDEEPVDTDWDSWDEAVPDVDWLIPDVMARGTLVWCYGSAETAKSMALMGMASELSHRGERVAYYGEEMDRRTEGRRLARFHPSRQNFMWKNGRALDLSDESTVHQMVAECRGFSLIILDSYERVWGNVRANENRRAVEFARVCHELILGTGATVCVIDHTGFPYRDMDGNLHDQTEPRGASAKRQQADTAILFKKQGEYVPGKPFRFTMENKKPGRLGNPFFHRMQVVDTEGGGLAVVKEELGTLVSEPDSKAVSESEGAGPGTPPPDSPENASTGLTEPAMGVSETAPTPPERTPEEDEPLTKDELARIRRLTRTMPRTEAFQIILAERFLSD